MTVDRWWQRLSARRAAWADAGVAGLLAVLILVFALRYPPPGNWRPFDGWAVLLGLACSLPLAVRRRWPRAVLLVTGTGLACYTGAGYQSGPNLWGPLLACYTVASRCSGGAGATATAFTGALWFASGLESRVGPLIAAGQAGLGPGIAWRFGTRTRAIRARNAELDRLTRRLAQEQAARARHAVTEERLRIARELHDVLANHMSVIAVQAGLAHYLLPREPETAAAAIDTIADTSRESLRELRALLGMLRIGQDESGDPADPAEPARVPGLDRLPELADRMRSAGLDVRLSSTGPPHRLAPGVDLAAFRLVQEALTNVLKHAGKAATATVALHYGEGGLTGRITDDGPGPPGPGRVEGSGHGLIGMRERVGLYGGTLHTGPLPGGGYEVRFTLPASAVPVG
ncbi:sensor histidine kinase [Kitasatospora sp. NPDC006697]|uniref:sensor histidine kinase n=1 Tax=Kitasatospora sp. NPDC006697 TaxID=3364020 RepID=UPI0036848E5F